MEQVPIAGVGLRMFGQAQAGFVHFWPTAEHLCGAGRSAPGRRKRTVCPVALRKARAGPTLREEILLENNRIARNDLERRIRTGTGVRDFKGRCCGAPDTPVPGEDDDIAARLLREYTKPSALRDMAGTIMEQARARGRVPASHTHPCAPSVQPRGACVAPFLPFWP